MSRVLLCGKESQIEISNGLIRALILSGSRL